jgi:hypothetical protein
MLDRNSQGHSYHLPVPLVERNFVLSCRPMPPYKQISAVFHVRTLLIHFQAWSLSVRDIIAKQLDKYLKLPVFTVTSLLTLSFCDSFYIT